jgi:hyperosmotically inducible periplasmic protein
MKKQLLISAAAALMLAGTGTFAADSSTFKGATKDAWIAGKVETAFVLNAHLNPFAISTDVDAGVVRLTGIVTSDIDRDLAGEVAKGVGGVASVKNDLMVDRDVAPRKAPNDKRDFGSWVDDATTTAAIKSKLVANTNTEGLKIDVDTRDDVVTLSGRVGSAEERTLAEQIAENTGDVKGVRNNLVVDPK